MTGKAGEAGGEDDFLRLDKWLFYARFHKSRRLAAEMIQSGKLRVSGSIVAKPHYKLRVGDVLTFPKAHYVRVVKVLALGRRRGPASEARQLYEDLRPPEQQTPIPRPQATARRDPGSGRPTKRDRRSLDRLRDP
jgi:ribosome-associated heat shock protein Hsp15